MQIKLSIKMANISLIIDRIITLPLRTKFKRLTNKNQVILKINIAQIMSIIWTIMWIMWIDYKRGGGRGYVRGIRNRRRGRDTTINMYAFVKNRKKNSKTWIAHGASSYEMALYPNIFQWWFCLIFNNSNNNIVIINNNSKIV